MKKHKILWVEDSSSLVDILSFRLKKFPFDIINTDSLKEAIELIELWNFDLIILDNCMPHEDLFSDIDTMGGERTGILFSQYIRLYYPNIPIMIFTGYSLHDYDHLLIINTGIYHLQKRNTTSSNLASAMLDAIDYDPSQELIDSFEFKVGVFGTEIDLKKFTAFLTKKYKSWRK